MDWHRMPAEQAARALKTDVEQGLDNGEVRRRQNQYGPNALPAKPPVPPWRMFLAQFNDFMVLVLLGATLVSAFLGETGDALTITVIVILNAVVGFIQEYRAERSLEMLKELSAPLATTVRGGGPVRVATAELVPGDVVLLEAGDRVPADVRLSESQGLQVEEAAFTGESLPVAKTVAPISSVVAGRAVSERTNMAFMSTIVTRGRGRGVVVAIGPETEIGHIAHMLESIEEEKTPLQKRLQHLGKWLVAGFFLTCLAVFVLGVSSGAPWKNTFMTAVSLAVAAIPEGLPAVVTIALALGVQRMIRRRAIVRKLPAVETLGSTTVICSDKTGTLTQNSMTVTRMMTCDGEYGLPGNVDTNLKLALEIGVLCNNARLPKQERRRSGPGGGARQSLGDPTEIALLRAGFVAADLDRQSLERQWPRLGELPFDSDRKMMSTIHRQPQGGAILCSKGAAEVSIPRCRLAKRGGKTTALGENQLDSIRAQVAAYGRGGLRVLAFAYRPLAPDEVRKWESWSERRLAPDPERASREFERDLVFVGLSAMLDPPRPEVEKAIAKASRAGIRTIMITGDHADTAASIAEKLGLLRPQRAAPETQQYSRNAAPPPVVTGTDLEAASDEELAAMVAKVNIFARVSPHHKIRIVRGLKQQGEIVAMTGDGVNDAPAIKEADIGIAMGQTGSDVSKEASDLVLSDDNYATIVAAVEEGRGIYDNIRKFIRYLLASNVGEVLVMFFASVWNLPLPMVAMQLLWMNLVTDGLPAIALGMDPPSESVMERPPRPPGESILARGLLKAVLFQGFILGVAVFALFAWALFAGRTVETARTMAFTALVVAQLTYVFRCRSESISLLDTNPLGNPFLVMAVAASFAMQWAVLYIPAMQPFFSTVPLSSGEWAPVLIAAIGSAVLTDIVASVRRYFLWIAGRHRRSSPLSVRSRIF